MPLALESGAEHVATPCHAAEAANTRRLPQACAAGRLATKRCEGVGNDRVAEGAPDTPLPDGTSTALQGEPCIHLCMTKGATHNFAQRHISDSMHPQRTTPTLGPAT